MKNDDQDEINQRAEEVAWAILLTIAIGAITVGIIYFFG